MVQTRWELQQRGRRESELDLDGHDLKRDQQRWGPKGGFRSGSEDRGVYKIKSELDTV